MDKWTAIMVVGCAFAFALICFAISGESPYDSYNRALYNCNNAKDYQTCMVAVNSGYTRMLKEEKETK